MSSEQFQALALGWVSALTAVALATGYAVAKVWPVIADIKARFDGLNARVDRHGAHLRNQDQTIASVALATPTLPVTPVVLPTPPANTDRPAA